MEYQEQDYVRELRQVELSSTLPDIRVTGVQRVRMVVEVDSEPVFDEWLTAGDTDQVELHDLRDLVEPYAYRRQTVTLHITATEEDNTVKLDATAQVVYCEADMGDTVAADYLQTHFLSILQGPKLTAPGRLEILPAQGTGAVVTTPGQPGQLPASTATCTARYSDGTTQEFSVGVYLQGTHFTEYDASPDNFTATGKTLVGYTIAVGQRSQDYEIDFSAGDCAPILLFFNSFGVEEVVYCTGKHVVSPTFKRSMAYVGHHQRNYRIDETREFRADTGPLTTAMANWLDDLFRSRLVRVANVYDGEVTPVREVVITDSKSEYSNEDDAIPRFTFTYQYAQRNHNVVDLQRAGRIFDNTFDNTFN